MVPSDDSSSSTSSDSSTTSTESSSFSEDSEFEVDNVSTNEPGSSSGLTQPVGEGKRTLLEPLGRWAARSKTPHVHVNALLKILKPFHPELPLDVRTLLGSSSDPAPFTAMGSGGENTSAFAGRIFNTLFTEDVTEFLTFYGKKPGSRAFFGSQIYDLILDVFNKWCASHASDRQKLEDAFKNVFKRAHDRQQRKCNKASTSVLQNDTQPAADLDKTPNENL
ncbi:hypothetical protein SprV_0301342800 [Sparganum proliferum]